MEATGTHCIAELYDCPSDLLDNESFVTGALRASVKQGMATLLGDISHKFTPQGVTALGLIAESHVAIHTWPECGYAAIDVFTCGDRASAKRACEYLIRTFKAGRHSMRILSRGMDIHGEGEACASASAAATTA